MSKITLKKLEFDNMFSYGENNFIELNKSKITQLTAPNGSGKSSIAMIIQEALFNKNVKGIKKGDILNRWSKKKSWKVFLAFTQGRGDTEVTYEVQVTRSGAQTKVQLWEDGVDISDHKVLDTYKVLSDIIGLDFDVFSQLTYQSSTDLLEFLKATDANRKKFLINLFNLEKYIAIGEKVKVKATEVDRELVKLQGELKTIEDFLAITNIPSKQTEIDVPIVDENLQQRIGILHQELQNYDSICKKIDKNNMYIEERDSIQFDAGLVEPAEFEFWDEYQTLKQDLIMLNRDASEIENDIANIKVNDTCPSCGQKIDTSHLEKLKADLRDQLNAKTTLHLEGMTKATKWSNEIKVIDQKKKEYAENKRKIERFETLTQLIDSTVATTYPDFGDIQDQISSLRREFSSQQSAANEAQEYNKSVGIHNARVDALIDQKNDFSIRQKSVKDVTLSKSNQINSLNILKKAFSTSGIVAFKLENLTKELENSINYYLSLLSDGQFQVEFKLDKEKLNISVINNGISTPIETVSGGEFSRIQTSILLAIRNLLSKLGGSSVNLLFLDEITGVLDDEGKEKLIEVLQKEDNLNVFLISHDFTHPLIDKISIVKEDNISCIQ
jgi:DNA repair exonuclease SbcCD ATPase subunit